jgi:hypothetical protein
MSKSTSRGSLIGLKATLPAFPNVSPVETTNEMEHRVMGAPRTALESVQDSHTDVLTSLQTPRRKEPSVLMNAKLPLSLHARLKRTAQFNDISMTDILIQAIEVELASGKYAAPPEHWGSSV